MHKKPVVLMILDGWGKRDAAEDNAIYLANPENFMRLEKEYPHTYLDCSGKAVGLPHGQMGNSEVGHLNMGAGRVVYQDITRISNAIADGSFAANPEILRALNHVNNFNSSLHLMGLLSDGGVHSHIEHLLALLDMAKKHGIKQVYIHAFLDGRDVPPQSSLQYIEQLEKYMQENQIGRIATLGGRYYGMDRDKRWDRVQKAYDAMVVGIGLKAPDARFAVLRSYENGKSDEFIEPVVIVDQDGKPAGLIQDNDSLIFFNFRADRARQISYSFVDQEFAFFSRRAIKNLHFLCMTQYDIELAAPIAFKPQNLNNTLGEVLAQNSLKQLRVAETEKYAHLTFFFNGGVEKANPGEDRILIPSPQVATYDLQPQMSAQEITAQVLMKLDSQEYDIIMINFANPDMVGHTGVLAAAVKAIKTVDNCIARIAAKVLEHQGTLIITADHGNSEQMLDSSTQAPHTAHTTSPVPFILVNENMKDCRLRENGVLADVAPTILQVMGLKQPDDMTGTSLIL